MHPRGTARKTTVTAPEKRRFVRVQLEFLLDIGRDFESQVPYELHNIERHMNGVVETGLRRHLTRRSLVKLVGSASYKMRSMTPSQVERSFALLGALPRKTITKTRQRTKPARKKGKRS